MITSHMQMAPEFVTLDMTLNTPTGDRQLTLEFDLTSSAQAEMHRALSSGVFYEPETTLLLLNILRPGDCFVDVGGHIGYFSVIGSRMVGPDGEVVTFEPALMNYQRLLRHLTLNDCTNVLPLHLAVGARDGRVSLHLNSDNDGGHALWDVRLHPMNTQSRAHPSQYDVWMARLARVLRDRTVRAMKLDIEGSELNALRGAEPLLTGPGGIPFIIAEINCSALEALGGSEEELRLYMDRLGYDAFLIQLTEPLLVKFALGMPADRQYVFNVLFWKRGVSLP